MRFNGKLHQSLKSYMTIVSEEGSLSYNGEYPKSVEKRLRLIHKQLDKMINKGETK